MADIKLPGQPNIKIELPDNDGIIHYSNFAIVSHSPEEFVIDFARILPGKEEARVVSRIIMTPKNAKNFLTAISGNIAGFEKQYGEIVLPMNPMNKFGEIQ